MSKDVKSEAAVQFEESWSSRVGPYFGAVSVAWAVLSFTTAGSPVWAAIAALLFVVLLVLLRFRRPAVEVRQQALCFNTVARITSRSVSLVGLRRAQLGEARTLHLGFADGSTQTLSYGGYLSDVGARELVAHLNARPPPNTSQPPVRR